jgi:hypothetical protein
MATLPNPLPRLTTDPTGRALGLDLPPGSLIDATSEGAWHEPLLWLADEPAAPGSWTALQSARTAGLIPVVVEAGGSQGGPDGWGLMPGRVSYPGDHDPEEVLADLWEACEEETPWQGLAVTPALPASPEPDAVAADMADALVDEDSPFQDPRLALVPARRSADIPTAIGWSGPVNHENDTAVLSAVLRSWEDRYGIRVVMLGFDHLLVSVAAPPTTLAEAEALAAEHFAFCPDNIWQSSETTLPAYAERRLLNQTAWHFWWD